MGFSEERPTEFIDKGCALITLKREKP